MGMDIGNDAKIRAARKVKRWPVVSEDFAGRFLEGCHAGTAGVNQRAVDVEKVEHEGLT
jgi:hypothetical protein